MSMTLKDAEYYLANRIRFDAGNLSAETESVWLDGECIGETYVVRSYRAIIATCVKVFGAGLGDGHISPDAYNHSKTTSKHANIVKKAWAL